MSTNYLINFTINVLFDTRSFCIESTNNEHAKRLESEIGKKESSLICLTALLRDANLGYNLPTEIGVRIGPKILIHRELLDHMLTSTITKQALDEIFTDKNIDLLGTKCICSESCPSFGVFLGTPCQTMLKKYMMLREFIIPDLVPKIMRLTMN